MHGKFRLPYVDVKHKIALWFNMKTIFFPLSVVVITHCIFVWGGHNDVSKSTSSISNISGTNRGLDVWNLLTTFPKSTPSPNRSSVDPVDVNYENPTAFIVLLGIVLFVSFATFVQQLSNLLGSVDENIPGKGMYQSRLFNNSNRNEHLADLVINAIESIQNRFWLKDRGRRTEILIDGIQKHALVYRYTWRAHLIFCK